MCVEETICGYELDLTGSGRINDTPFSIKLMPLGLIKINDYF
jgi:hypothetical protein